MHFERGATWITRDGREVFIGTTEYAYGTQPESTTARVAPTAPPSSAASSSIKANLSASPSPRPPETTMSAASRSGPSAASVWRSTTRAAPA